MIKIKLTNPFIEWPMLRQTPRESGIWGDYKFFINEEIDECDYWVVYDGLLNIEKAKCHSDRIILITAEPPNVKSYDKKFIDQFSLIMTPRRDFNHPNVVNTHPSIPWRVGVGLNHKIHSMYSKTYDELKSITSYKKEKVLSVISSDLTLSAGHVNRRIFVDHLKDHFGDALDFYGRGINNVQDKWDAIFNYKYHLAIENSSYQDYWTEKLADTYLAGAYPFYYGAPNVKEYFPDNSMTVIDINDVCKSIKIIEHAIQHDYYEKSLPAISIAKDYILDRYNMFPMICNVASSIGKSNLRKKTVTLYPENYISKTQQIYNHVSASFTYRIIRPLKQMKRLISS